MRVRSLALTTELGLAATRGRVVDRGNYIVVETPDDRSYVFGNLLVLSAPPQVGEVSYWIRKFEQELERDPRVRHAVTLRWDEITGDLGAHDELRAAGFSFDTHAVLAATEVRATGSVAVRPLAPQAIRATAELAWAVGDRHDESYRQFLHRRAAWHQRLVSAGAANFWGVFEGSELVASLGLIPLGAVARFQDVQTALAFRRRGFASALLATAATHAFRHGVERVVIVAEPDSDASRLYQQLGFRMIERTVAAWRYPPSETASR